MSKKHSKAQADDKKLYQIISKIFPQSEIRELTVSDNVKSISIGKISQPNFIILTKLFNIWCQRVDILLKLDREINPFDLTYSVILENWRGFTFSEYQDLFNDLILEDEFPFYPIFHQLNRSSGGIKNLKQRLRAKNLYNPTCVDYIKCLESAGLKSLIKYFISDSIVKVTISEIRKHVSIIAPTSAGKTVLMEQMLYQLIKECQNSSFVLIDPHGGLSRNVKKFNHLKYRCIYLDPVLNSDHCPSYNPFNLKDKSIRNISSTVDQLIRAFDEILSREGGDLTETMVNMLEKCLYFLLNRSSSTLSDLIKLLEGNTTLAAEAEVYDPIFESNKFLRLNNKTREGLLNRIGRLLNSPVLKNLLGGKSSFDLERMLNSNIVIIFNLSSLGEMAQIAFGRFLMANIKSIVRKRQKPSVHHTYCFIDEVHNFVGGKSESFEYILSQLRGFGLHMIMANQYPDQLGHNLKPVIHNTAVKMLVEGSSFDLFKPSERKADLKQYEFLLKIRGQESQIFKSSDEILHNPEDYYLTEDEEQEYEKWMINNFYSPIQKEALITDKDQARILVNSDALDSFDYTIYVENHG